MTATWRRDESGLWHWQRDELRVTIYDGAAECLDTRTAATSPCWFWWAESPCPVVDGDTVSRLVDRWSEWRTVTEISSHLLHVLRAWSDPPLRTMEYARTDTLSSSCIAQWNGPGPETQILWRTAPGRWEFEFILRTGSGVRTVFNGVDRAAARAWLDANGFAGVKLRP